MNLFAIGLSVFLLWPTMLLVSRAEDVDRQAPNLDVLSADKWKRIDNGIDRGLAWLALQQRADGSFPTMESGQPAVTSLAVMAFLSRGHVPGVGPYGKQLDRAIDFVVAQQQREGLLYGASTDMPMNNWNQGPHVANYNHAIAGLMLGEVFGMTDEQRMRKLRPVIEKAIAFARRMQRRAGQRPLDKYGWRYYKLLNVENKGESDLSVTAWFVMFYRSARNAGFDIPQEYVDDAVKFVAHVTLSKKRLRLRPVCSRSPNQSRHDRCGSAMPDSHRQARCPDGPSGWALDAESSLHRIQSLLP